MSLKSLGVTSLVSLAALAACATPPSKQEIAMVADAQEAAGIVPASRAERDLADQRDVLTQATFWGKEYEKNPNDSEAQLKFSRALRAMGSAQRATEISRTALSMKPDNVELAMIFAQASLDMGKPEDAAMALAPAEAAGKNDWRMLSLIGVTMDQLDKHQAARDYYQRALQLSPDNSKILCNIGLSYALDGDPVRAEQMLRQAAALPDADPRVKQNLVLVLGVQGKFSEAQNTAGQDTPKAMLDANDAYFKALLTPARNWEKLRGSRE
jgi:Flp pilus assembly protein TadD